MVVKWLLDIRWTRKSPIPRFQGSTASGDIGLHFDSHHTPSAIRLSSCLPAFVIRFFFAQPFFLHFGAVCPARGSTDLAYIVLER